MPQVAERPVVAPGRERPAVQRLDTALAQGGSKLVADGREFPLPASVAGLLRRIVHELSQGHGVTVVPVHTELTTQNAAELLNVSRPYLVKLLQQKKIPYRMVGTHRRVRLEDLLTYRERRTVQRRAALEEIAREAQRQGRYD